MNTIMSDKVAQLIAELRRIKRELAEAYSTQKDAREVLIRTDDDIRRLWELQTSKRLELVELLENTDTTS